MIKDEKCWGKYNLILKKVTNIINKEFDSEPLLIKKHLRAEKEINTKEGFKGIYIPVKLIDSVYRKDKNYYSQVFSEIYNFIVIEKKMSNFKDRYLCWWLLQWIFWWRIIDKSDNSNEESSDEKIQLKKIKYINLFLGKIRKIW